MLDKEKILVYFSMLFILINGALSAMPDTISQQDTGLTYATELFNEGKFEQALPLFKKLVETTPDNKILSYYYGACLVELDTFSEDTKNYLLEAISGNTPDKIFYYVGKYFQNNELWSSAIKYYERFQAYGSAEEKEGIAIDELIAYCNNKLNPQKQESNSDSLFVQIPVSDSDSLQAPDTYDDIEELTEVPEIEQKEEFISFIVNSDIEYLKPEHFKNQQAFEYFTEGVDAENELNRNIEMADSLREVYSKLRTNRDEIAAKILSLEEESLTLKKQRDQLLNSARQLEQNYWLEAEPQEINTFVEEVSLLKEKILQPEEETEEDLTGALPEFLIQEDSFLPDKTKTENNPSEESIEIIYKIQIGAYSRGLPAYIDRLYKKLSLIRKIDNYTDDRGVTVYTTGNLTNFDDAVRLQSQVRQEGVEDAFVVAYKNGKRITLNEAKELTNNK